MPNKKMLGVGKLGNFWLWNQCKCFADVGNDWFQGSILNLMNLKQKHTGLLEWLMFAKWLGTILYARFFFVSLLVLPGRNWGGSAYVGKPWNHWCRFVFFCRKSMMVTLILSYFISVFYLDDVLESLVRLDNSPLNEQRAKKGLVAWATHIPVPNPPKHFIRYFRVTILQCWFEMLVCHVKKGKGKMVGTEPVILHKRLVSPESSFYGEACRV